MAKSTKYYALFSALKAGGKNGVSPESLAQALNFNQGALAVYIHALRHKFGAEIEPTRNGRKIVSYRLVNIAEMETAISPNRKPRTTKSKSTATTVQSKAVKPAKSKTVKVKAASKRKAKEDGIVEVPDADLDITEITDADFADIKNQLGIA